MKPALPAEAAVTITVHDKNVVTTDAPMVNDTLKAALTGVETPGALTYKWEANTGTDGAFAAIEGATGATFDIPATLLGKQIKVTITAANYEGSKDATTKAVVEDTALYRFLGAEGLKGQPGFEKTTDIASSDGKPTDAEIALYNVADFGTAPGTQRYTQQAALDGWGYKHWANKDAGLGTDSINNSRQTQLTVSGKEITLTGPGQSGMNGAVSFILKNLDKYSSAEFPTSGVLIYTFDTVVRTAATDARDIYYGFTKANDGTTVDAVAAQNLKPAAGNTDEPHTLVMTYNLTSHVYTIIDNGVLKATGTQEGITGIYAQSGRDTAAHINNLVVTLDTSVYNTVTVDPAAVTAENAEQDEDNQATLTADRIEAKAGDKVTVTATARAGRKATVKITGGTVTDLAQSTEDPTKWTFTMPATAVTVSADYSRADIGYIEVTGPTLVSTGTTDNTFTAKYYTDNTEDKVELQLEEADDEVTWTVEGGANATDTKMTDNKLAVASNEADNTVLTVKAEVNKAYKVAAAKTSGTATVNVTTKPSYAIKKADSIENGEIEFSASSAIEGTKVYITVTPNEGYELESLTAAGTGITTTDLKTQGVASADEGHETDYYVTVGTGEVTISATFKKTEYTITDETGAAETSHGSITLSGDTSKKATMGTEITFTATPSSDDYIVQSVKVTQATGDKPVTVTKQTTPNTYKFTMPADNVKIKAVFSDTYYEEDFDSFTGKQSLVDAGWNINGDLDQRDTELIKTKEGSDKYAQFRNNVSGGNRSATINVYDSVINSGSVVLEADLNFKRGGDRASLFKTSAFTLGIGKDDKLFVNLAGDTFNGETETASATEQASKWVHLKAIMDYSTHKVKMKVTAVDGGADVIAETTFNMLSNDGLQKLDFNVARNASKNWGVICANNISVKLTKETVTGA